MKTTDRKLRRNGKLRAGVHLLKNYTFVHLAQVTEAEAVNSDFELRPYPSYTPDLAPSEFFQFPKLKSSLHDRHVGNNDESCVMKESLEHQSVKFYSDKVSMLRYRGTLYSFPSYLYWIIDKIWRCPWCNGYRRRKWTRRHEFKSWTRLIAFHIAIIPLGKVWIQFNLPPGMGN